MKIAVKIALLITVETARGMHTALPRVLDALHAAQASATVCLHLGRDAGAPLTGRRRERARWYGWGSLWRGRVWPGARLDKLAPAALKAIGHAGCVAGLHLEASRVWRGTQAAQPLAARVAQFRRLAGLAAEAPFTVNLPGGLASWPLLRQMQALGVGALTGVPGQHGMRQQAIADRAQHMPLLAPAGQQPGKLRLPDAANPLGIQPTQRRPSQPGAVTQQRVHGGICLAALGAQHITQIGQAGGQYRHGQ